MAAEHPEAPESKPDGNASPPVRWAVEADGADCDHPTDALRFVGDDGRNAFARCERCGSVLVARLPVRSLIGGPRVVPDGR